MNKKLMLLVAATAMLASCSNDEPVAAVEGNVIQFRSAVNSRGEAITNSNLKQFAVSAFYSDGTSYFQDDIFSKYYSTTFKSVNEYCWPVNGSTLYFTAYAPADMDIYSQSKDNIKLSNFSQPNDISKHADFITAYGSGSLSANKSKDVALEFTHHLSQIEVQAYNSNDGYVIYVAGVRIGRVYGYADFDNTKIGVWDDEKYETSTGWDIYDSSVARTDDDGYPVPVSAYEYKVNYTSEYDTPVVLNDELQSIMGTAGNALVIPQELTAWASTGSTNYDGGAYLAVKIKVTTNTGALVFPATDKYEWVATPFNETLKPGNKYTYALSFTQGFGYVDPEKGHDPNETYDPEETATIDKDDPYKPGSTTEGSPIRITGSVSEWESEFNGAILSTM